MTADNPPLSPLVRVFMAVVILVLAIGVLLLVAPELVLLRFPWALKPYTARFLGAFYTAEMVAIVWLAVVNRWSPGRLILGMAFVFTAVVTAVSFAYLDRFNFGRKGPWGWFIVYAGSMLLSAYFVLANRGLHHPGRAHRHAVWRFVFVAQAVLFLVYGLMMLILPAAATSFWPWAIDAFHARLYSAIFIATGMGAAMLAWRVAWEELVALGAGQLVFGAAAIVSPSLVDAGAVADEWSTAPAPSITWSDPGTMIWLSLFLAMALFGLASLGYSWSVQAATARSEAAPRRSPVTPR